MTGLEPQHLSFWMPATPRGHLLTGGGPARIRWGTDKMGCVHERLAEMDQKDHAG